MNVAMISGFVNLFRTDVKVFWRSERSWFEMNWNFKVDCVIKWNLREMYFLMDENIDWWRFDENAWVVEMGNGMKEKIPEKWWWLEYITMISVSF